jgi:hypothetical protein
MVAAMVRGPLSKKNGKKHFFFEKKEAKNF